MSVPSNIVYSQGTGAPAVTADNLNTLIQVVSNLAGARAFSGTQNQQIFMQGSSSINDGGQGTFAWVLGTGTDDAGVTTIVPTGNTSGYWSRITQSFNIAPIITPQLVANAAGVTLTAANIVNLVLVRSGAAGVTDTLPSAASIIAGIAGAQVGSACSLLVVNTNSGTLLLSAGSGVTLSGNLSGGNFSLSTLTQKTLMIYVASTSTVTIYG